MPNTNIPDYKTVLWKTADSLRAPMDAAEYKLLVLGLIFLKYISGSFVEQRKIIEQQVTDPESDSFLCDSLSDIDESTFEDRDYYTKDNVFWVPASARWEHLCSQAKQPDIGAIIDSAMTTIESENLSLKGKMVKRFGSAQLPDGKLGELIDLISTIGFDEEDKKVGDVLGEVYEYFLGQFASAEGKKGGQFFTPRHVVRTLVEVISPHKGRIYDPCCGTGGMFVSSEEFIQSHGLRRDDISIYGQELDPTTWQLGAMNLAIRGLSADLGKEPADTFANDQHKTTKFDYILANPPFNISDWGGERYENDARWIYGRPPAGNANYAWLQHILSKLKPDGQAGVVLANGSMSSRTGGEGDIRKAMVHGDVIEVMVAFPGQLFLNTQIPVCLWFLTNDKTAHGRDRQGKTLFIDARELGTMISRVQKEFTAADIGKIAKTVEAWRSGKGYEDTAGFCKSATIADIEKHDYTLTPGRYVGVALADEDGEPFDEKMARLTAALLEQQEKSLMLDMQIKTNLESMGLLHD